MFTDTYLASQMYDTSKACVVCASDSDSDRGWVKSRRESDHRFWLCDSCLDKKPTLKWEGDALKRVEFP